MPFIKIHQIDAFTDQLFKGNPAAVCVLEEWLSDELMQAIANENNLAETAFIVPKGDDFEIRWFTPAVEVDLCGHATLASAFVLFNIHQYSSNSVKFYSHRSGWLSVTKEKEMLYLDFPSDTLEKMEAMESQIEACIGHSPFAVFKGKTDFMCVVENENTVKNLQINLSAIAQLGGRGLIVTAKGDTVDFVSRFFAPQAGIDEDPVTGSAHTTLSPYWSKILGKTQMNALQLSTRGGKIHCEYLGERCRIGGQGRLFLSGEIYIE